MTQRSGHCLCGAVTYSYNGPELFRGHCHCESCRRACASPMTTFFGVANGSWEWTGVAPAHFESSPGVHRYFCGTCGSPMAYAWEGLPEETHFYAATLDDPTDFQPDEHHFYAERLPWLHINDDLKKKMGGGL